jgi:hypothetical protein
MLRQAAASTNSSVMISAYKGRPRPAEPPKTPAPAPKDGAKPTEGAPKPPEPPKNDK